MVRRETRERRLERKGRGGKKIKERRKKSREANEKGKDLYSERGDMRLDTREYNEVEEDRELKLCRTG